MRIPRAWSRLLREEQRTPWFDELKRFVAEERAAHEVFPRASQVFAALSSTPPEAVSVVLLGQDPYHDVGQAHGLCFSVNRGVKIPPSLRNMYQELRADLDIEPPAHGCLTAWAERGVLLLNTVLTVRAHQAGSHQRKGWEKLTDAIIRVVSDGPQPVVFLLWGGPAQKKKKLIDLDRHRVVESAHPSPLSAPRGFHGSKPYSRTNAALAALGRDPIDWSIPD